jgi:hypothetical protein
VEGKIFFQILAGKPESILKIGNIKTDFKYGVDWIHLKMAVFWVVAPCSLVEVYQRFRGPCSLHHHPEEDRRQPSSYSPP